MAGKKKQEARATPKSAEFSLAKVTQYVTVSLAGLAGFVAYSSGASMEGALARAVVVLLICTVIGYGLNLLLWLSEAEKKPSPTSGNLKGAGSEPQVGTKIDMMAGDDKNGQTPARGATMGVAQSAKS